MLGTTIWVALTTSSLKIVPIMASRSIARFIALRTRTSSSGGLVTSMRKLEVSELR